MHVKVSHRGRSKPAVVLPHKRGKAGLVRNMCLSGSIFSHMEMCVCLK